MNNPQTDDTTRPNAFAFKVNIEGEYVTCICPRINDEWVESEIFTIASEIDVLSEDLDNTKFSVIFVRIESESESSIVEEGVEFSVSSENGAFLRSNETAMELYQAGKFFEYVEAGYQKYYFDVDVERDPESDIETELG